LTPTESGWPLTARARVASCRPALKLAELPQYFASLYLPNGPILTPADQRTLDPGASGTARAAALPGALAVRSNAQNRAASRYRRAACGYSPGPYRTRPLVARSLPACIPAGRTTVPPARDRLLARHGFAAPAYGIRDRPARGAYARQIGLLLVCRRPHGNPRLRLCARNAAPRAVPGGPVGPRGIRGIPRYVHGDYRHARHCQDP